MFKRTRQDDFYVKPNCNMLSERSRILTNTSEAPGSSLSIKDEHFKIYGYSLLNQQVLVATKNGITKYTYNASGLKATKTTENKTVKFYYEGSKIINEETNDTLTATYLYRQGLINRKNQESDEVFISEKQNNAFAYFLRGKITDSIKKLVKVGRFMISLEGYPVPKDISDGDTIEFTVQRLDIY